LLKLDARPSASIRLPESAALKVSASVRRAYIPDTGSSFDVNAQIDQFGMTVRERSCN